MVEIKEAPCHFCVHYFGAWLCEAFPRGEGIPQKIRDGEHDHRSPYPGDNGVIFESKMKEKEG
jgi:hypothetical protein